VSCEVNGHLKGEITSLLTREGYISRMNQFSINENFAFDGDEVRSLTEQGCRAAHGYEKFQYNMPPL